MRRERPERGDHGDRAGATAGDVDDTAAGERGSGGVVHGGLGRGQGDDGHGSALGHGGLAVGVGHRLGGAERGIGGVLFGEHVGDADFRIVDVTTQAFGGNAVAFRRKGSKARRDLKSLANRHSDDPTRFNYLGEWHSHPHAPVDPSRLDEVTMYQLLRDPESDVHFLVLLINRLNDAGQLELSATAYLASGHKIQCDILIESCEPTSP